MSNVPRWQQRAAQYLIDRAKFEKSSVGFTAEQLAELNQRRRYMPNDSDIIGEAVALYVDSWIIPVLEALRDGDRETAEAYTLR
ncbi:MAG: hypothetical protein AAGG38_02100 [Planctomycetota bacterium]